MANLTRTSWPVDEAERPIRRVDEITRPGSSDASSSTRRPLAVGVAVVIGAYVTLTALMVGLGYVLIDSWSGARHWDVSVNRWFVGTRDGWLSTSTSIGSHLAETLTVIALGALVVMVLWVRHDRWSIVLIVVALGLEVSVFLTTTLLVDRHRPPVPKLDGAPPTSSFPSGHTAAACALYLGLVVLLNRGTRRSLARMALSVLLALVPIAVGVSRVYRGMHHPTDVFAGALLGVACLGIAWRVADVTDTASFTERANSTDMEGQSR
jgi:undecaprenyl-diphosphatase